MEAAKCLWSFKLEPHVIPKCPRSRRHQRWVWCQDWPCDHQTSWIGHSSAAVPPHDIKLCFFVKAALPRLWCDVFRWFIRQRRKVRPGLTTMLASCRRPISDSSSFILQNIFFLQNSLVYHFRIVVVPAYRQVRKLKLYCIKLYTQKHQTCRWAFTFG